MVPEALAAMTTVAVIQTLGGDLGVPVVTSMQAKTWGGLRALEISDKVSGFGRLWQLG